MYPEPLILYNKKFENIKKYLTNTMSFLILRGFSLSSVLARLLLKAALEDTIYPTLI